MSGNPLSTITAIGNGHDLAYNASFIVVYFYRRGRLNIPVLYLHRFLRLTPLLAVAILINVSVIKYVGSGPQWPILMDQFNGLCEDNWWKTLLYVQNYVTPEDMVVFDRNLA